MGFSLGELFEETVAMVAFLAEAVVVPLSVETATVVDLSSLLALLLRAEDSGTATGAGVDTTVVDGTRATVAV